MRMKKTVCFLLLAVMLLSLVACSNGTDQPVTDGNGAAENATDNPTDTPADNVPDNGANGTESNGGGTTQNGNGTEGTTPSTEDPDTPVSNDTPTAPDNKTETDGTNGTDSTPVTEIPEKLTDCTYEDYHNMTPEVQKQFVDKFEDLAAFFDWYNAAKKKYEKEHPTIGVENGEIDISNIGK